MDKFDCGSISEGFFCFASMLAGSLRRTMELDSTVVLSMPLEETSWSANGFGLWKADSE